MLGRGGMGVVYRARDPRLERAVALKVLTPSFAPHPKASARLLAEARAASALDHPNICTILEAGRADDGSLFVTMPLYGGETLQRILQRGPLPVRRAMDIACQVADGLACAHNAGIVHRDIKPANLLVTDDGLVKILDFGVAKAANRGDLTEPGSRIGTLAYMAPEQIRGEPVNERADVWSLGIVLYEMLAGTRPFRGAAGDRVGASILHDDVRPTRTVCADVPENVEAILEQALARSPRDRYGNGLEMLRDLREVARGTANPERQLSPAPLPAPISELIGREAEIEAIESLLAGTRLLTLTGPGGTGKTRLAMEVGRRSPSRYTDGYCFVELASIQEPELVPMEIARALGLREVLVTSVEQRLTDALRHADLLLILDNLEHLLQAAPFIGRLLTHSPGLRMLVTSRAPLRIAGEQEFSVPPLAAPGGDASLDPNELLRYDAIRLFVVRASAIDPNFALTPANAATVVALCERLDGLPLAIELAAARVRLLPLRSLLKRLEERFDVLSSGARDLPSRQRTLHRAIGWSYDLLQDSARLCLQRLAVFAGGFTVEAAEAVCGGRGKESIDVLEALDDLANHSLLRRRADSAESRLHLLETIRTFAREKLLEAGDLATARADHAAYFCALAEREEPALTGNGQLASSDLLEAEHDNLHMALLFAAEMEDVELGLRLTSALWRFWIVRGHVDEGRRWIEQFLEMPADGIDARIRARELHAAGSLAQHAGDNHRAAAWLDDGLKLWREIGDEKGTAAALVARAWVACELSDLDTGENLSREGLEIAQRLGDRRSTALALNNLGWVAMYRGDGERARNLHRQSLDLRRELGDRRGIAFALANLADAHLLCSEFPRALESAEEALREVEPLNDRMLLPYAMQVLSRVALALGDEQRGRRLLLDALPIARTCGNRSLAAVGAMMLAKLHLDRGAVGEAVSLLEESLSTWRANDFPWGIALTLIPRGRAFEQQGLPVEAKMAYETSLEIRRRLRDSLGVQECEVALERLRAGLTRSGGAEHVSYDG
ncbi:MAG: protein kinase [Gemmatimonas sp.]|nr:protein kinase [Gemmatimonas sp.]